MRRIFRGQETFGEGSAAEQATRYRLEKMYDDVVEAALANSADVAIPEVDLLVSLSGFSPETTMLAFELVRPKELLVISSKNVATKSNFIYDKLRGRREPWQVRVDFCDPADPYGMYEIVRKAVRSQPGEPPVSAIIDITGGKKVMSAAAALAAAQLDLKMCYIDSNFDAEMRIALPGTERIRILANPTELFGDQGMASALELFGSGSYSGARARFAELSMSISEPVHARFLRDLSGLYQAWCDLDSTSLTQLAEGIRNAFEDPRLVLRPETRRRLADQIAFVANLAAKDESALLLNFFLLGEHYLTMRRYDFAALLFYRTIEQSVSERLKRAYGGFDLEKPDYALLLSDQDELRHRYVTAVTRIVSNNASESLPWNVGLFDAVVLLHVLDDEMLPAAEINGLRGVGYVRSLVDARNRSVLAHGTASVTDELCDLLRNRALNNLRAFWRLHHKTERVDDRIDTLRFVTEA